MQKLEKQFHIHCVEGDVGRYVHPARRPGPRARPSPPCLTTPSFVAQNREYTV